jgi:hypothetical protein
MRKATEDVLARTEAERQIGDVLEREGLIDGSTHEPTEVGRAVLNALGRFVEFETGTSKDPDRQAVAMRRLVTTGPWEVDPNGVAK